MNGNPTIHADALTKRYGDTTAVDALDLAIPSGAIYGFLGPNGVPPPNAIGTARLRRTSHSDLST